MSFTFLLNAVALTAIFTLISLSIKNIFITERKTISKKSSLALSKAAQKSSFPIFSVFLSFYHKNLQIKGQKDYKRFFLFIAHYISIHFMIPLWGFSFFLHTNVNFLVIIISIFTSFQLHQRLYLSHSIHKQT